jgi:hypothetical protein
MKASGDVRSRIVALLLVAVVTVALVAIGCFGGGGDSSTTTLGGVETTVVGADGGTTLVATVDQLSSFKSKDPFIPQAQLTTTTATTLGPVKTTTTRATTTTRSTTTTVVHQIKVTAFPGGGTVSFTLDGVILTGFGAGPALFTGGWGTIQITGVNDTLAPYTATFKRNGSTDITLLVNQSLRLW